MRFLVDAQLPPRLTRFLNERGLEAMHVAELDGGVTTPDLQVARRADKVDAVVVSKDEDFRHAQITVGSLRRLLLVTTGNISNSELFGLFGRRFDEVVAGFAVSRLVELRQDVLVLHGES